MCKICSLPMLCGVFDFVDPRISIDIPYNLVDFRQEGWGSLVHPLHTNIHENLVMWLQANGVNKLVITMLVTLVNLIESFLATECTNSIFAFKAFTYE